MNQPEPMRVLFLLTSMPVGGAETLLVNLVRRMDRNRFDPEIACLKNAGPLGELLSSEMPVHTNLLASKWDLRVLPRLVWLLGSRRVDAVVTVGAGDKMFWGRIAAWIAGVPVIASALHSTGWPDGVGRLNRWLTSITDAFIGVAKPHGRHLVERERFPERKVFVIPNGVDTDRFAPPVDGGRSVRESLGIGPTTPLVGILAALRPEKNHELFLAAAARLHQTVPDAEFVIIGDGPRRAELERIAEQKGLCHAVHFLGSREDVPELLGALDVVALTSHNEANPVSILEAMATSKPVVACDVGSVAESVIEGETGFLVPAGDVRATAERWSRLLLNPLVARAMGDYGRERVVRHASLDVMVHGYERLLANLFTAKTGLPLPRTAPAQADPCRDAAAAEREPEAALAGLS